MKRKIDWLNHGLEFAVVLIGILIAFQLNKCSENRTRADLINNHLENIEEECHENEKYLSAAILHIENQIINSDSLISEVLSRSDIYRIRTLSTKLLDMQNVDLNTSAYEVLVQSGDIRFLSDYKLKKEVISMYNSFESVEKINNSTQNLYDNHFYPYLKSNFDLVNWGAMRTTNQDEQNKYFSKEFGNTISTYRYLLDSKKKIYENQLNRIQEFLK